jgi:hypothetical protein
MKCRVYCTCGAPIDVEETAAGTTTRCTCGRSVAVPSLRDLRRQSGVSESSSSPALEVQALLLADRLPDEDHCVLCGVATDGCVRCRTECEKVFMSPAVPWWHYMFGYVVFGWLGALLVKATAAEPQEFGTDRVFDLPLRVCDTCRHDLTSPSAVKKSLRRVPLYWRLLD